MSILLEQYNQLVHSKKITEDPVQVYALTKLQKCYDHLSKKRSWFSKFFRQKQIIQGVYLWGGVGLGKTFIMDIFFNALPFHQKKRIHFHSFMQNIQLLLRKHQGEKNPLELIATQIASETKVLCFDEFFVSDIADAMILERFFSKLFSKGIVLIATSNISPSDLYSKGLHYKRFKPAIELIEKNCDVFKLCSLNDYRRLKNRISNIYFLSREKGTQKKMHDLFLREAGSNIQKGESISIENRLIQTKYYSKEAIWFDFIHLCNTPRSQVDFLMIAQKFPVIFISNVPIMQEKDRQSITYFIYLIDIFYDNHSRLFLSIEDKIENLYVGGDKFFEYQRTLSRLHEMQTNDYTKKK